MEADSNQPANNTTQPLTLTPLLLQVLLSASRRPRSRNGDNSRCDGSFAEFHLLKADNHGGMINISVGADIVPSGDGVAAIDLNEGGAPRCL
jgi:hypothetical protein